jgi:hypothetical protein
MEMARAEEPDREAIWKEFGEAVNMTPATLERWLATEDSHSVGWTRDGEGEAVGHQEGRRVVETKRKKKADLTDDDYAHMREVVGYVRRHLAQGGPAEDKEHSRWRYSLMNWGHDPLKE